MPSCPSRAVVHCVHCDIAKPSIVYCKLPIATLPSPPLQHCQSIQRFIAEPSSALSPSCPSPSRPLMTSTFLAVQCFITEPTSRHPLQAVLRDIAELSSAYCRAVQRFIAEPSIAKPPIAKPSIFSRPVLYFPSQRAVIHCELSFETSPSCPALY